MTLNFVQLLSKWLLILKLLNKTLRLSLICDEDNQHLKLRKEIIVWSIKDWYAILIDFKVERKVQFRIGTVQIDNQIALDTPFPVTLFSVNSKK